MPEKDNWAELKDEAVGVIKNYFKGDGDADGEDLRKVKVATSLLSSYTRHEQTESAREQTALIVGRELANNKDEFAEYIKLSVPRLPGIKVKELETKTPDEIVDRVTGRK